MVVVTVVMAVVAAREVASSADDGQVGSGDTANPAEGEERLMEASLSKEKDAGPVTKVMATPAGEFAAGRAGAVKGGGEGGAEAATAGMVRGNGRRRHGGGSWKRMVARALVLILTILLGVVGALLYEG